MMWNDPVNNTDRPDAEARWPALVGLLAIGGLFMGLPDALTPGPNWLLLVIIAALGAGSVFTHRGGMHRVNLVVGYALSAVVTLALAFSLGALIAGLPSHRESATALLLSAGSLWLSNILVFASWYWRLDAGGPHQRDLRGKHVEGAFLFPQMTVRTEKHWAPGFVDYLSLAFNTSTAFSPADVAPLTRWAKMLMMVQSMISLGAIVILGARAVNIL